MERRDLSGQLLDGRYRVVARIGKGGMGSVYRADDEKLRRVVAVKVMNEQVPDELGARKRFDREAKAMAMLEHPHCASILDVGMHEGQPFVVMDFIAGQSLDELVAMGPVPIPRAVELTRQVLFGLAHAHEHGIVHRDIKPANVVLSQKAGMGDHVKILDFGLAKLGEETSNLTAGVIVGTPSYMSPEQIRGLVLDGRADVYACGVMLFELLTGAKPFRAETDDPLAVCMMHLSEPVPRLADKAPGRDFGALEEVITHALAKNREHRFGSAMAFANALAQATRTSSPTLPTDAARAALGTEPTGVMTVHVPSVATMALDDRAMLDVVTVAAPPALPTDAALDTKPTGVKTVHVPSLATMALDDRAMLDVVAVAPPPIGSSPPRRSRKRQLAAIAGVAVIAVVAIAIGLTRSSASDSTVAPPPPVNKPVVDAPAPPPDAAVPTPPDDPVARVIAQADQHLARRWRDGAIDVLIKARRSHPDDPRLPYRAGLLYMEKLWWPDGIKQLRAAIALDPKLRGDPALIKATIRAFTATAQIDWALAGFLREDLGETARPFLEEVAASDKNAFVRNRARSELARRP